MTEHAKDRGEAYRRRLESHKSPVRKKFNVVCDGFSEADDQLGGYEEGRFVLSVPLPLDDTAPSDMKPTDEGALIARLCRVRAVR